MCLLALNDLDPFSGAICWWVLYTFATYCDSSVVIVVCSVFPLRWLNQQAMHPLFLTPGSTPSPFWICCCCCCLLLAYSNQSQTLTNYLQIFFLEMQVLVCRGACVVGRLIMLFSSRVLLLSPTSSSPPTIPFSGLLSTSDPGIDWPILDIISTESEKKRKM